MVKKSSIYIMSFLFSIHFMQVNSFFEADSDIDIYNTIANGYEGAAQANYEYELTKQGTKTIGNTLNDILSKKDLGKCIKEPMDSSLLSKLSNGEIDYLYDSIADECKKDEKVSNEFIATYVAALTEIENTMKRNARQKTKKTYEISRIGLYSDGNTKNSPFDLVDDIKQIEKIVFSEELIYKGEVQNDFNSDFRNNLLGIPLTVNGRPNNIKLGLISNGLNTTSTNENNDSSLNADIPLYISPGGFHSNYVCSEDINLQGDMSGFSEESLNAIIDSIQSYGNTNENNTSDPNSSEINEDTEKNVLGNLELIPTGYKKVNDNAVYPCSSFFCIKIEMVVHNNALLGGGNSWTIESILNYSNETLKKFSNTSLQQAKMSTNNFELGLLDLKLPDMFHMGVQIQKRSPPILNIDNQEAGASEEKEKGDPLTGKNLMIEQYKNLGLDYERANSLQNFIAHEAEVKTVFDSMELPYTAVDKKINEYYSNLNAYGQNSKKNAYLDKAIENKTQTSTSENFRNELYEVEKFSAGLKDYAETLVTIIKGMNKIPINKN